jgi:hypothetical protein
MNCLWRPCLLMDRDKISNHYRPFIDASYQVSVHLTEQFQRGRLKCEKLTDDGRQTTDAKWWQKLTLPLARWAKNTMINRITMETVACLRSKCHLKQNLIRVDRDRSGIPVAFPISGAKQIHKQEILSDTRTGILSSNSSPCDFLPTRSDEFQKVCNSQEKCIMTR